MARVRWIQNATDRSPIETEFHPEREWVGGQGIVGETREVHDPTYFERYGNGSPDGVSRIMFGWGEGLGNFAFSILKAQGKKGTWQELRDLVVTEAKRFEGLTHEDYERIVGRGDSGAAPGSGKKGSTQHNPIWLKGSDPKVSPSRVHAETWQGSDGTWYGLDDKSRGVGLLPAPLGTSTSGGGDTPQSGSTGTKRDPGSAAAGVGADFKARAKKLHETKPRGAGAPLRTWATEVHKFLGEIAGKS